MEEFALRALRADALMVVRGAGQLLGEFSEADLFSLSEFRETEPAAGLLSGKIILFPHVAKLFFTMGESTLF